MIRACTASKAFRVDWGLKSSGTLNSSSKIELSGNSTGGLDAFVGVVLATGDGGRLRSFGWYEKTDRRMSINELPVRSILCRVFEALVALTAALRTDSALPFAFCNGLRRFVLVGTGEQIWRLEPLPFAAACFGRLFFAVDLHFSDDLAEGVLGNLLRFFEEEE